MEVLKQSARKAKTSRITCQLGVRQETITNNIHQYQYIPQVALWIFQRHIWTSVQRENIPLYYPENVLKLLLIIIHVGIVATTVFILTPSFSLLFILQTLSKFPKKK